MTNGVMLDNEIQANKFVARIMRLTIVFIMGIYLMNMLGIFIIDKGVMTLAIGASTIFLLTPTVLVDVLNLNAGWVKYVIISLAIMMVGILAICLSYHVVIIYMYGVILTSTYFSKRLSVFSMVISVGILSVAEVIGYRAGLFPDANITSLQHLVLYSIVPRQIQLISLSSVFILFNNRTQQLLRMCVGAEEQKEVLAQLVGITKKSFDVSATLATSVEELTTIASNSSEANKSISENSQNVTEGVQNTVNFLERATDSVRSIADNLDKIATRSENVGKLSQKVSQMSKENGKVMGNASGEMQVITEQTKNNKEIISSLGDKSKEIKNIVEVISGIANQTNLLALNAAIESARAGEQGKGFAVVADEIRKLAEQSQKSALHITEIIEEVDENTQKAVAAMDKSVGVVESGLYTMKKAEEFSNEMVNVTGQMNVTMQELTGVISHTAESSEQIVRVVEEVSTINDRNRDELEMIAQATKAQQQSAEDIVAFVKIIDEKAGELLEISNQKNE